MSSNPKSLKRRLPWILAGLLVAAFGIQLIPAQDKYFFKPPTKLADYLPRQIDDWVGQDMPLGETELVRAEVDKILQADDVIFRLYHKNGIDFGVYVCYWKPSHQNEIDAGSHNPDNCWVQGGWKPLASDYDYQPKVPGGPFQPAQYRFFESGVTRLHVMFWHFIGGKISGYAVGEKARWDRRLPLRLAVMWDNALGFKRSEQFVVRLSSTVPFEQLSADKGFQEIFRLLEPIGIKAGP